MKTNVQKIFFLLLFDKIIMTAPNITPYSLLFTLHALPARILF